MDRLIFIMEFCPHLAFDLSCAIAVGAFLLFLNHLNAIVRTNNLVFDV